MRLGSNRHYRAASSTPLPVRLTFPAVNQMALKNLRARQILLMLAGVLIIGCFIRGVMSVREGKFALASLLFIVCLLLSAFFKEKIAILYIGLIFLAVSFSMSAQFDRSGKSILASIVLWGSLVALAKWDNKRRIIPRSEPRMRL
jgi:Zn-dependent protease with chaperone function